MDCIICRERLVASDIGGASTGFCAQCDLHSRHPEDKTAPDDRRTEYGKGDFWSKSGYDIRELLETDFSSRKGWDHRVTQESMLEYCRDMVKGKKSMLEIGVGTGVHLLAFDRLGFSVTGIEPDPLSTRLINERLKHGRCHNGFFEDFKFDQKFDLIFLYHVVEHLEDPVAVLRRCGGMLKEDGLVIIAVPDCENPDTLVQSAENPYHLWHFSKRSLKRLVGEVGCYSIARIDSFSRVSASERRFHKVLKKAGMGHLSRRFCRFYPLSPTSGSDGYEVRLILSKRAGHDRGSPAPKDSSGA